MRALKREQDLKSKLIEQRWLYRQYWIFVFTLIVMFSIHESATAQQLLGDTVDVSQDFTRTENTYFLSNRVLGFDPATGVGTLEWKRYSRRPTYSFNKMDKGLSPITQSEEFPAEYDVSPALSFSIEFTSPRTIRLRINTSQSALDNEPSLMLVAPPSKDSSWKVEQTRRRLSIRASTAQ